MRWCAYFRTVVAEFASVASTQGWAGVVWNGETAGCMECTSAVCVAVVAHHLVHGVAHALDQRLRAVYLFAIFDGLCSEQADASTRYLGL
jgi:hypothetical protein